MKLRDPGLPAVSSLADPVRARLYQVVSEGSGPIGRDQAAAAAGIGRSLAAYHLDKLVELGLLTAAYQRSADRTGPGAGRPAKVYALSGREFAVTVPPREYELAARLLAAAVDSDPSGTSRSLLLDAARQFGTDLGASNRAQGPHTPGARPAVEAVLRRFGFEPASTRDGTVLLRNCPFHQLVAEHRDLVCGMNLALLEGVVSGMGERDMCPGLDPQPGRCCVVISPGQRPGEADPAARS